MEDASESGGILQWLGEMVGNLLSALPSALVDFFTGVGEGAGISGYADWGAFLIGLALILSGIKGLTNGKIVGSIISGAIGVGLMSWAVT